MVHQFFTFVSLMLGGHSMGRSTTMPCIVHNNTTIWGFYSKTIDVQNLFDDSSKNGSNDQQESVYVAPV